MRREDVRSWRQRARSAGRAALRICQSCASTEPGRRDTEGEGKTWLLKAKEPVRIRRRTSGGPVTGQRWPSAADSASARHRPLPSADRAPVGAGGEGPAAAASGGSVAVSVVINQISPSENGRAGRSRLLRAWWRRRGRTGLGCGRVGAYLGQWSEPQALSEERVSPAAAVWQRADIVHMEQESCIDTHVGRWHAMNATLRQRASSQLAAAGADTADVSWPGQSGRGRECRFGPDPPTGQEDKGVDRGGGQPGFAFGAGRPKLGAPAWAQVGSGCRRRWHCQR